MKTTCDVAVVGAGLGGLSCAALLARAGLEVVLFERDSKVGGLCTSFKRGEYVFDAGPTVFKACSEGGEVRTLLEDLDLWQDLAMLRPDPGLRVVGEGYDLCFASGENVLAALGRHFPSERDALARFERECDGLVADFKDLFATAPDLWSLGQKLSLVPKFLFGLQHLKRYGKRTSGEVLDRYFDDASLKTAVSSLCPFPLQISAALLLALVHGASEAFYYPRGGTQTLSEALAAKVTAAGGSVQTRSEVARITVEEGRAVGVELADGTSHASRFVVSNADGRHTFFNLIGQEHLPAKWTAQLEAPVTGSNVLVSLGVDRDLREEGQRAPYVLYNRCCEPDRMWGTDAAICPLQIRIPSLADASVAPPGHSVVQLLAFMPYDCRGCWGREADGTRGARYRAIKEEVADCLIRSAEEIIPGLSQHVVCKDVSTPLSYERYTLNSKGASGWLPLPGDKLRSQRTPIRNLFQAGQWTFPGAGVPTVVASGRSAADLVLRAVRA